MAPNDLAVKLVLTGSPQAIADRTGVCRHGGRFLRLPQLILENKN
jgi:hypothetical protein